MVAFIFLDPPWNLLINFDGYSNYEKYQSGTSNVEGFTMSICHPVVTLLSEKHDVNISGMVSGAVYLDCVFFVIITEHTGKNLSFIVMPCNLQ